MNEQLIKDWQKLLVLLKEQTGPVAAAKAELDEAALDRISTCTGWHLQKSEMIATMIPQGSLQPGRPWLPPSKAGVDWHRLMDTEDVFVGSRPTAAAAANDPDPATQQQSELSPQEQPAERQPPQLAALLSTITAWLQDSKMSAQLHAAGLSADALLQQLQETAAALDRLQQMKCTHAMDLMAVFSTVRFDAGSGARMEQDPDTHAGDKQLGLAFVQRLYSLGVALSALPLSCGCSNPRCAKMEDTAAGGGDSLGGSLCSGCRMARFCDKACLRQHWKQHKPVCQALAAAAAAAKAGGSADA